MGATPKKDIPSLALPMSLRAHLDKTSYFGLKVNVFCSESLISDKTSTLLLKYDKI